MAQENILYQDLFLEQALVVEENGKTVFEIFNEALKGKTIAKESLEFFQPMLNGKKADWDDLVKQGDKLQVLPHIAGGY